MAPSADEIIAARLSRIRMLLDELDRLCTHDTQRELLATIRQELDAARESLRQSPS